MISIEEFEPDFAKVFPDLCELFKRVPLCVHEGVTKITLQGLCGAPGEIKDNSELDLRLLVDEEQYPDVRQDEELLKDIIYTTMASWREKIRLDLTVVFDTRNCDLKCFGERSYNPKICVGGGYDCFGMYKIKDDGNPGFVLSTGNNIRYIYPCITVWKNPRAHG